MPNSDHNDVLKLQLKVGKHREVTVLKQSVLEEFVNLFQHTGIQAMLLESEMEVMEQSSIRWVSVIVYYNDLGRRIKHEIQTNFEQWAAFRDTTGVIEVELFTRPFTDAIKCMTRIDLKGLGGWDDSPIKYGVRPVLIW
jgi:hypothetical protein